MKLTHFFILIFVLFSFMFVLFNPQLSLNTVEDGLAQMEIEDFMLYEIDKIGVQSVVSGTLGRQYPEYYEVENAHYVENKNKLGEHLYADKGRFENDVVYLDDNVRYFREDGLSFESDHAVYDTKKDLMNVPETFILTQNENIIYGRKLHYNSLTGQIRAEDIDANYYTQEKK